MRTKIRGLLEEFTKLTHTSQQRRTDKWKEQTLTPFLAKLSLCLDISCKDQVALGRQEKYFGVKMTEEEHQFLADQLGPRKMLCTTEVDK